MLGNRGGISRFLIASSTFTIMAMYLATFPLLAGEPESSAKKEAGIAKLDKFVKKLLDKYQIPGATVAVMKDGRLVYTEGYGLADKAEKEKAKPDSMFRIASVSKTITAIATLKLVDEGKLGLDERAFEILDDLQPPAGSAPDPRLATITVRDLLRHSGGWVTDEGEDPQYMSLEIAAAMGTPSPPDTRTMISYWMGRPLQFDPGTKYSYCNFGYNLLGRIIEKRTGQTYESNVFSQVLLPAGIRRMQLGNSLKEQRARGEGAYHANAGDAPVDSVFPSLGKVPMAYGGWSHEALDAHGGWVASAVDLMRYIRVVEGSGGQLKLLSDATLALMTEYQGLPGKGQSPGHYYALGWTVDNPGTPQEEWGHTGALEGSNAALLVRRVDGISYAILFNALPTDIGGFFNEMIPGARAAVTAVTKWPDKDLFPKYQ